MTSGRGPTFLTSGPDQYNQDAPFAPRPDTILGLGGNDTIFTSTLGGSLVYGDSLVGSDLSGNDVLVARGPGDTLFGGPGNDSLLGRAAGVALVGGDGRDTIVAEQPATLYGGAGRDLLVAVSGGNLMFGNQDEDTILGGLQGNDTIYGGQGDDLIGFYSASGQSNVGLVVPPAVGGANQGNNWVNGNKGNDTIVGINTGDSLYGGQDNDSIVGVGSLSYLSGDEGNDTLRIQNPTGSISPFDPQTALVGITQVTMMGGAGNDSIIGPIGRFGEGQNFLDGGAGNDTIMSFAAEDTLLGGEGDDFLSTNTSAQLTTQGINSSLSGFAGGSVLDGGPGNDTLVSIFASDSLFGGEGNDSLLGRRFSIMDGGDGNNTLNGGEWLRTGTTPLEVSLFGGAGNDLIIGAQGTITNVIAGGAGDDTIVLGTTNDILLSDTANTLGNDSITAANLQFFSEGNEGVSITNLEGNNTVEGSERNDLIRTGSGNDLLLGGAGDDTLLGGGGNDFLFGGSGNDLLDGGPGDDTLEGGFGVNTLVGGEGNNQFFYRFSEAVKTTGADFITDFNQGGNDRLVFVRDASVGGFGFALVPGISNSELGPNQFIYLPTGLYRDADASINTPVLIYEQASGVLKYDENGSLDEGVFPVAQFGQLPDGTFPRISASDILII
ncbi:MULTISPECIES: calcium-binding protein [Limnospira]|uniref:Haemolysin-type calcium-binding toxin, RTX-like (Expressed) n=1 Tax=Limnospira indica PCC 8005 TaxID=376219 RepID=A0A9P1KM56_9CYAN|nr:MULTISPECIES: calcium-binding protein [Limnospira]MDT9198938.1 calcium-binding protein [Limnospira sp. PMC 1042.18]CDM98549.1 putative haemolysin-type calcium-binding toxin, RTX-like (expressed) [Limnospira indica PCC 8005]